MTVSELVRVNCGLTEGGVFSQTSLEEAVKSVYKLGNYEDVRLIATPGPYGYDIEIRVVELPILSSVEFKGNKKIKDDELEKSVGVLEGKFISRAVLFNSIKNIEAKYIDEGMYGVDVKFDMTPSDTKGYHDLVFHIDEGEQKRVREIEFEGNEQFSDAKLRGKIETKRKCWWKLRSGKFKPEEYREDIKRIENFYHNKGFITAQVTGDSIIDIPKGIKLKIWLNEGIRYYYRGAEVSGNDILPSERILSRIKLETGDVFNQEKMEKSLQGIYRDYGSKGYIHARVEPERHIEDDSIFVSLEIEEGPQAHVRMINIEGNTRTFEKVIRRELVLYPGNVFDQNLFELSARNIYFLNYFEDVVPDFNVLPNGDVDIIFDVMEKPIGRFQIGAGYNALDKIVGNISIGWPNVLGRGWTLDLVYEFGKLRNSFSVSFTEPWFLDTPTSAGIDLYNTQWTWSGHYTLLRQGGALRLGRKLRKPRYFSLFVKYELELVEYKDINNSYIPSPVYDLRAIDWPELKSALSFTISRDSRDSRLFASKGSKNSFSIESAGGPIGGEIEFQKMWLKSDLYFPIHKYLTLVGKGHLGLLMNFWGDDESVPYGERFWPGGISFDGQIRGYPDRSIGPLEWTNAEYDSTVIPDAAGRIPLVMPSLSYQPGARAVLTLTAELRFPIMRDQLYISAFADAGNAWLTPREINVSDLFRSAGLGVRFVIPMIGIFGLDFGYGFDRTPQNWEIHFQIGPEF